jgi:putative ATPase
MAVSTYNACQMIGMPECDVVLSHCVTFFARSPKSVEVYKGIAFSYKAMKQVKELIENEPCYPVPLHLRNAVTLLDSEMDYGKGYKYNPDYVTNVQQEYLPAKLRLKHYFDFKPVKL